MSLLNETHDPALQSWVTSANAAGGNFPIQNLPFAMYRRAGSAEAWRIGVAIGDGILDLAATEARGVFAGEAADVAKACTGASLNPLMALDAAKWSALRLALSRLLRAGSEAEPALRDCLMAQSEAEYDLPASIGDYTDFYTSIHHATRVGRLFRPDNPLLPNYKWVPIGYHGRSSSIGVSGQAFARPRGQTLPAGATSPIFGPSQRLDYELELGVFVGCGNEIGKPIPIDEADGHVFGLCLLNDWSARDLQAWEYQPLGPFLSKSFATTISPWIVTLEALAPYRVPWQRPDDDPQPLPYLASPTNRASGAFDIQLQVLIETARMREVGEPPAALSRTSFRHAYWTIAQMVAHHTVNGCNLRPGDLLGSGTQSGPAPEEAGSLLELTVGGQQALVLPNGEARTFLEDGDAVLMRAWCDKSGAARIGFGEVMGRVLPAAA
ncbi:fumarylacetoacetase [Zoogloea sp. LCSB751]|uniref:fumarylacetoacetase n=1 Tax=Zoogloea sp. LCSB751 TaxID=1965277 RepID=UPI0009A51842|nr:fumarylacetoacetase [Zoogloea sp. LCSB751]